INASNINTLTGAAADLNSAYSSSGISNLGNEAVTLSDTSLAVTILNALDGRTSGAINASSINTLSGAAADLNTAYTSAGISNLGTEAVTLSDTSLAASVLNILDGRTSGAINASSINTLTGSAADLNTAYTSGGISNLGNEAVTLSDTSLAVSVLNILDGRTSGAINASSINSLSGSAADLITAYDSGGITGLGNETVNINSGTASTSQANALAADTSGVVTATLSDGDMATLAGLTGTGNAYTINITDTSVAAADLNTLDGKTSVAINASNITTLSGSYADLTTAFTANSNGSISGLGNEAVSITEVVTTSQANTLAAFTAGVVTATLSDGDMATLADITETGNAYTITITDNNVAAAALNTLDGKTSVAINASNVTTLSGSYADLNTAFTANSNGSISGLGNEVISVSGAVTTAQANTLSAATSGVITATLSDGDMATLAGLSETGNAYIITITDNSVAAAALNTLDGKTTVAINASNITTLTGAAADLNTAYASSGLSGLNNEAITLTDSSLAASVLNTLDGNTSGSINANSINTITGTAADLITAYASGGITGLGNEAVNVNSGSASTSQANTLAAATSAVVSATLSDGDMANLAGLSETGNAYTITITDISVAASALNTLDGKTSVAINASNITMLTGAAADLNTAYGSSGINNLGDEAVTLSDTTLAVSVLNALDGHTSGAINASTINTLTGVAADLNTAYTSGGISNLGNEAITLSDTSLAASVLNTLDGHTSGAINASSINTLTGAAADLNTAYTSGGINNLGNEAVTLSDTSLAVSVLNLLDGHTSGTINASSINTLSGAAADLNTAYTSGGISNLGNEAVTLSDTSLAVSVLNALDGRTSGAINASSINTLSGAAADLNTAYASGGISNLGNEAVTLSDTSLAVSVLNILDGHTSGTINASSINTLTGAAADLNTAYTSGGINNLGNEAVTLSDTSLAVSVLNDLDGNTSGTINANSINTLSGTAADLNTAYGSSGINNLGDQAITLSDTSLAVSVLNILDGHTSGTINASSINKLSGAAADLNTAYTSGSISNLGNEAVTLSDTSLAVSVLNTLDSNTSGTINAGSINTLSGAAADLSTAYTSGGISNLGNEAITLSDTSLAVSVLNILDGHTSGTINASSINTLTGAAADLNTAYTSGGISNLGNEAVTLSDTSLSASVLNTLDGRTSGAINASSINTLSGSYADLTTAFTAYSNGSISGLDNEAVSITEVVSTSQANNLAAATSGVVTATLSDGDLATLAGLTETGNAYSITISDASVAVSALNTLDGKTTVAINASNITTLTGAAADLNTAYTSRGISNLGNEAVTLNDTSLNASVLNALDGHTSGAINANSINTLTGSAADLITAYDSGGITGLGNETVNVNSGTASTSQANALAADTSGVVTATISNGDMATLAGLSETGNAYAITITDNSVAAAALNTLDGKTSVAINASNINTLTGAAADLNTAYTANGSSITGLGNEAATLSDTSLAVSVLNDLDGNTSGTINAGSINSLSGTAADLITAYDSGGINGLGNEAINVNSGSASTAQANALAADTSGVVTATISDGDMDTLTGLTETGNAYTITITDNSVAAAALNTL
ncbi:S-layer family protein, partial [Synechococcus sp. MIT S9504]|uniref:beta strand repeat-containing protein n=2 Tax=Synechococcus sp. MIT S9504 TaxID=1801628 RepID=UPI0018D4965D